MDPTLCRGQTHGACYNTPGGYQCGCGLGYHAHYFSATGTGSFTCLSEYMFDRNLFEVIVVDRNSSLPSATIVAERQCFQKRLSVPPVKQTPPGQTPPPGQTLPRADPPDRHSPPPSRPLQRVVRILLECILVLNVSCFYLDRIHIDKRKRLFLNVLTFSLRFRFRLSLSLYRR